MQQRAAGRILVERAPRTSTASAPYICMWLALGSAGSSRRRQPCSGRCSVTHGRSGRPPTTTASSTCPAPSCGRSSTCRRRSSPAPTPRSPRRARATSPWSERCSAGCDERAQAGEIAAARRSAPGRATGSAPRARGGTRPPRAAAAARASASATGVSVVPISTRSCHGIDEQHAAVVGLRHHDGRVAGLEARSSTRWTPWLGDGSAARVPVVEPPDGVGEDAGGVDHHLRAELVLPAGLAVDRLHAGQRAARLQQPGRPACS